jgi:hypothetical protein
LYRTHNKNQKQGPEMKRLLFAGTLVLATTAAQAQNTTSNSNSHPVQAYTSIGPAGAGAYRESSQRDNYRAAGKANPHTGTVGARNPR